MRKFTIIWLVLAIAVAGLYFSKRHAGLVQFDRDFRNNLPGTWSAVLDDIRLTNVVRSDGSFTNELIFIHSARTNIYVETGTWIVEHGRIIETVTSDTNPAAARPRSHSGRILRAGAREFAVRWKGSPDEWVWQKTGE